MSIPGSAIPLLLRSAAPTAYQVERSLRCNSSDSGFCSRTFTSAGNRKTWTWAGWVKRSRSSSEALFSCYTSGDVYTTIRFLGDTLQIGQDNGGGYVIRLEPSMVFRDFSAWYHVLVAIDTTQATSSDRVKVYINGVQVTAFSTASYPSQNLDTNINRANEHTIGQIANSAYFSGYLADIHFIDGQALTPSSFTEVSATTGQLIPKAYSGPTPTGNSFWLPFSDNSAATATTLGKDNFNLGNNWTPNNLSVTAGAGNDSLTDTPTSYGTDTGVGGEVRGNYATLNPLAKSSNVSFTNGNLDFSGSSSTGGAIATIAVSSGKWYWECVPTSNASACSVGIAKLPLDAYADNQTGTYIYLSGGNKRLSPSTDSSYGASYTDNDVIGVALDMDAGTVTFYKNNVSQGTAFSSLSGTFTAWVQDGSGSTVPTVVCNFGQRPFAYTAPSGFKALVDTNLTAPVVAKPNTVMDVKLYTGNGSTQTVSGLGFSPDLVWLKVRSAAVGHGLFDQVRGAGKALYSHATNAEYDYGTTSSGELYQFNSDGFNLGSFGVWNVSSQTSVAWCWDAGSSTVTNTQGSITSQVRANASAGFSIIGYTGTSSNATVGHGLGVTPGLLICKSRTQSGGSNWVVWHSSFTGLEFLRLNTTDSKQSASVVFNSTAPTSSVISLGTDAAVNGSGNTHIIYAFAPVAGYSSGFSYTGNGSTDGPMVYLGFRPRYLIFKRTDAAEDWLVLDSARDSYNVASARLLPNSSAAEGTGFHYVDFLSNGFKIRNTQAGMNASNGTFVGFAFAESPFQYARAR